jgi:hypothetical protein
MTTCSIEASTGVGHAISVAVQLAAKLRGLNDHVRFLAGPGIVPAFG